ncbi:Arsenical pump membrane protein [Colletotrichum orbiculare MAFF 240422]|uniref:Arsenical pump membrane protein n=1 Tax=Colletotrichum orbiculare (strain 104-T / ATCC 96160 / CBS 514.97 / LARS 414 / MAFF 240422) TaxID=1213857 RepID=N4V839_COLOR|nr:Arsenical pump membrane protein [Colletotrichum orbiculare MAFF 240422]
MDSNISVETDQIREWRSIVTLIVFCIANIIVLFPFHLPLYVPRRVAHAFLDFLSKLRVIAPRKRRGHQDAQGQGAKRFVRLRFPMNSVTAPLIADLFLLAILAIGRKEVHDGTIGEGGIFPLDIMIFFITLAYIAISIDASGLIRYLALKVLQWGGEVGHRLFFYLYAFFFGLGAFIGNDPIILSGTAFLSYMTRVSNNIAHPRAWIFTQFAIANIASAILVSSNPTNLVLAGAFNIKFIEYTANMVVPVVITAIVLFPFLLYIIFANEGLIPVSIQMRELPAEAKSKPVNPNIPNARGSAAEEEDNPGNEEEGKLLSLVEIMNPFLDKGGAAFGAVIMSVTLITVLALNAASVKPKDNEHLQVFWVTLPAAFVMLCWDLTFGWLNREETRQIARKGREDLERARLERGVGGQVRDSYPLARAARGSIERGTEMSSLTRDYPDESRKERPIHDDDDVYDVRADLKCSDYDSPPVSPGHGQMPLLTVTPAGPAETNETPAGGSAPRVESSLSTAVDSHRNSSRMSSGGATMTDEPDKQTPVKGAAPPPRALLSSRSSYPMDEKDAGLGESNVPNTRSRRQNEPATLVSLCKDGYRWSQETFPTVMAVISHLPFALVPFAFAMFVLVQALVTKGWVPVFAHGWDHWVEKTGTIGAIGGMGFLSVILCNFAGTNIGTTILLSRVIQTWQAIHQQNGIPISDRTFWATVYSMALGVNYGAFSTAFSASLAGLLWRDILERKHIHIRRLEFARVNVPIIAIAMTVGCTVLVGEIYIIRKETPYHM